jgi:hypothetical protein
MFFLVSDVFRMYVGDDGVWYAHQRAHSTVADLSWFLQPDFCFPCAKFCNLAVKCMYVCKVVTRRDVPKIDRQQAPLLSFNI